MTAMDTIEAIRTRRSVRRYGERQVERPLVEKVLEAGAWAPTGHGSQDPFIVAVQDSADCAAVRRLNAEAMGADGDPYYAAPTIVVVFAPAGAANAVKDASLVLGNMMLAAHSLGLASCWINRCEAVFSTGEGKALMEKWGLPGGLEGIGSLALGYPVGPPRDPKPRKEGYWRVV